MHIINFAHIVIMRASFQFEVYIDTHHLGSCCVELSSLKLFLLRSHTFKFVVPRAKKSIFFWLHNMNCHSCNNLHSFCRCTVQIKYTQACFHHLLYVIPFREIRVIVWFLVVFSPYFIIFLLFFWQSWDNSTKPGYI